MRWTLRPQYFRGAGPYMLSASGRTTELQVDASGAFELPGDDFPIGIYAKGPWSKRESAQSEMIRRAAVKALRREPV